MSDIEEEFVNAVPYPTVTTMATTLGYQVLSLMGSQIRDVIASTISSTPEPQTNNTKSNSTKDRRWHRRPGATAESAKDDLPIFTLDEVSYHDTPNDCWMIIYDRVYDVTSFLSEHPGGDEIMLEYAGRDATLAFRSVGHSSMAETLLKPFLMGILVEKERIWTRFFNMNADSEFPGI
jgi:cytochrome b involved in lipid metabolism